MLRVEKQERRGVGVEVGSVKRVRSYENILDQN